jgi:spore maturation protein CgeB
MQKLAILVGDNPYETTRFFAKSLAKAFERLGIEVQLHWVADYQFCYALEEIRASPPLMTLSFSDIHFEGRPIADLIGLPHLTMLLDPALYFLHQLQSPLSLISSVDQKDVEWLHYFGKKEAFFLPHGAEIDILTTVERERPYEAVFFGTCIDYKAVEERWGRNYAASEAKALKEAVERVLSSEGPSILEAILESKLDKIQLLQWHQEIDHYVRGKDRIALLQAHSQHSLHIWGDGPWRRFLPNAKIWPAVSFDQTIALMQQATFVLNSSPRFKSGSHERIFYGALSGACVVTGENPFIHEYFVAGEELLTYAYGSWSNCLKKERWQEIAEKGQRKVRLEHTWDARAAQILKKAVAQFH